MKNASKTFAYTAQRGSYISTVCALLFIMLAEGGLIAFLIVSFVPNELIKFACVFALSALFLNIGSRLLAPLWTKHRLETTSLRLRYGLDFKADVPRDTIIAARQVRERVAFPLVRYEAEKGRISAVFSEQGQVLLVLDQPYPFRVGLFGRKLANQLLINVEQCDEFLADLAVARNTVAPGALQTRETLPYTTHGDASVPTPTRIGIGEGDASVPTPRSPAPAPTRMGTGEGDASVPTPRSPAPAPTRMGDLTSDACWKLAIRTEDLTRRYKGFVAVDKLNLAVQAGEIYGFLGSNGAGKTTTMKMLVGLLRPDAGRAWIAGHDVWMESMEARGDLGYVADRTMLYDRLTGREFLDFLAQIRGMPEQEASGRIEQLLDILELRDRADTACGTYSFGMKRKLAIAGALIHEPRVLILDEPLNGLDPLSARRLKDLFAELVAGGTAIFLSTHDLATAESICHRVGIIHKGRLLVEGSSSELRQIAGAPGLEDAFLSLTAEETGVPV